MLYLIEEAERNTETCSTMGCRTGGVRSKATYVDRHTGAHVCLSCAQKENRITAASGFASRYISAKQYFWEKLAK